MAVALLFLLTIFMESEGFIFTWKEKGLCLIYLINLPIVNFQGFPKLVNFYGFLFTHFTLVAIYWYILQKQ